MTGEFSTPTVDLPVSEDQAGRLMHELGDPDRLKSSLLVQFGTEAAEGRWSVFAVRRAYGPDGQPQCWASLQWLGRS
jgi:hypothetical protein